MVLAWIRVGGLCVIELNGVIESSSALNFQALIVKRVLNLISTGRSEDDQGVRVLLNAGREAFREVKPT